MMKELRKNLAKILAYEDVALLVRDITDPLNKESFFGLSPHLSAEKIDSYEKIDLFYYNPPNSCLSMIAYNANISKTFVHQKRKDMEQTEDQHTSPHKPTREDLKDSISISKNPSIQASPPLQDPQPPAVEITINGIVPAPLLHLLNPRAENAFVEGIDNLSPILHLKDTIYVQMATNNERVGVLQLFNKKRGFVTKEDLNLAFDLAKLLGNYLHVMMTNLKLTNTLDRILDDVGQFNKHMIN